MHARRRPPSRWLAHLNVFLPAAALILYFGGSFFMLPAGLIGLTLGRATGVDITGVLVHAFGLTLALGVPIWLWRKGKLLPAYVAAERIGRYRVGHALIALTNVAVIGLLLVPMVIASVINEPDVAMLAVLGLAAAVVGTPVAIAGLVCVYTAGAAADEAVA
jgi:hypothetical protein